MSTYDDKLVKGSDLESILTTLESDYRLTDEEIEELLGENTTITIGLYGAHNSSETDAYGTPITTGSNSTLFDTLTVGLFDDVPLYAVDKVGSNFLGYSFTTSGQIFPLNGVKGYHIAFHKNAVKDASGNYKLIARFATIKCSVIIAGLGTIYSDRSLGSKIPAYTRVSHTFVGYSTDNNVSHALDSNKTILNHLGANYMRRTLLVFPHFTPHYIRYEANLDGASGSMILSEPDIDDAVTVKECEFSKNGYRFQKWNTSSDGSGTDYLPGYRFTDLPADLYLYAIWQQQ